MKKWTMLIAASCLTLSLAACGQNEKSGDSDLSLEQVYEKTVAQSEKLTSAHANVVMTQTTNIPSQEVSMETSSDLAMNMTLDPLALYQEGTVTQSFLGDENVPKQTIDTKSYLTNDQFYVYDGVSKQWMKLPTNFVDQLMAASKNQTDLSNQLKELKPFLDQFTFEEKDDVYVLKMKASGDEFNDFIKKQLKETLPPEMMNDTEAFNSIDVKQIDYEIHIEKESFQTSVMNMVMDMSMAIDSETVEINQNMKSTYSKWNEIEPIVVPEEVVNNASSLGDE